ncbi:benzyl alcohol O-benzoyltransferase-like [Euphorbia lathyris]|uniref:benzyl alcohol O-benzoyltransferase-like n=1 Tax=Euphorbia lathyris TaxID=212925 RepID=UPI003313BF4D
MSPTSLIFNVHRHEPELITPAKPTPHEFKPLSDLDDQDTLRVHIPVIQFYPYNPSMDGVDPVKLIRKAISETLVFYYPFAGRLREGPSRKLTVECTGEGILFVEADADVSLHQFNYPLLPPFPCFDQLVFGVTAFHGILHSPLLLVQVTRLNCGGFILGLLLNHTMSDAAGLVQFISAVGEIARGSISPTVLPTWERHVLISQNPPQLTSLLPEFDIDVTAKHPTFPPDLCCQSFFFGATEISALRRTIPQHLRNCSSFEIVTACVWKCRIVALQVDSGEETSVYWPVNLRNKLKHLIPPGYYGNAIVFSMSNSTAKEIIENPLSYALQLVRNGKDKVNEEYVRSVTDMMVVNERRPRLPRSMSRYTESDLRYAGFEDVDFGWGKAVYGGPAFCAPVCLFHMPFKNKNEQDGIMLPVSLPSQAMERFTKELNSLLTL